jgi:hypothetical protein
MNNRQKTWLWISAAASLIVGILLVWNDSGAGWFLIIMGIAYLGVLTRPGQEWTASNPGLTRWALIGVTLLLVLLAIIAGTVLLFR